jgi:hypothetical protein
MRELPGSTASLPEEGLQPWCLSAFSNIHVLAVGCGYLHVVVFNSCRRAMMECLAWQATRTSAVCEPAVLPGAERIVVAAAAYVEGPVERSWRWDIAAAGVALTGLGICWLRTPAVHSGERLGWRAAAHMCRRCCYTR